MCKAITTVGLACAAMLITPASLKAHTGVLEICKTSDTQNPVTGNFTFRIVQGSTVLTRTIPVGACTGPITLQAGEATITEAAVTGVGVNLITALSGILNRLIRSDLGERLAHVTIVAGDASTQTLVTFRNARTPTGFLEICKDAAAGTTFPAGTAFTFTISGLPGTRSVPVGACTGPIQVPAGSITITEAARPDAELVSVTALPANRLVSRTGLSAVFTIVAGDLSTQTVARFVNRPTEEGQLKICKVAGTGIPVGTEFTIAVLGGATYTVPAGPAIEGGFCVVNGTFPVGTLVTVRETIPTNVEVQNILVDPVARLVSRDLGNGSAVLRIGSGFTEVTFVNRVRPQSEPPTGQLKICKIAGPGVDIGTLYTITATPAGGTTQTYRVPAGPAAEGGFCVLDGTFPVGTAVTVDEVVPANNVVTSITVDPAGRGGVPNLATGTVVATIGSGFTEVTFTNREIPPTTFQVCKVAGTNVLVGERFTFDVHIGGMTRVLEIAAGTAANPTCSANISVVIGTLVRVVERAVTGITVSPAPTIERTINEPTRLIFTNNRAVLQACSPGYFKNHVFSHLAGSNITMATLGFAGTAIANFTLQQALGAGGGGVFQLGRLAAAAYLNLLASGVNATVAQAFIRSLVAAGDVAALAARADGTPCTLTFPNIHQ